MSREHIVTDSFFQSTNLKVHGFKWLKGETKTLGLASLTANILCRHHNSELSVVDTGGLDFWNMLREFNVQCNARRPLAGRLVKTTDLRIDATLFERWCLKTLINYLVSGSAADINTWQPTDELVQLVFGLKPFALGTGLGYHAIEDEPLSMRDSVELSPLSKSDVVVGGLYKIRGLRFVLTWDIPTDKIPPATLGDLGTAPFMPHPRVFKDDGAKVRLLIDWTGNLAGDKNRAAVSNRTKFRRKP